MLKACRPPSPLALVTSRNVPFPVFLNKTVLADAGDQNVGKAVVVIVADRHTHAVHFDIEAGGCG